MYIILIKTMSKIRYKQNKINIFQNAKKDDADAQYKLAKQYFSNNNFDNAFYWVEKSANGDNINAQNKLGWMYVYGIGINQDLKKAFEWYEKSAKKGNINARYNLADMYSKGIYVKQDYIEAIKWYKLSANNGNARAQICLAYIYNTVINDKKKALYWHNYNLNNYWHNYNLNNSQHKKRSLESIDSNTHNQSETMSPSKIQKTQ